MPCCAMLCCVQAGEDRYDVGLAVRAPSKGLCVPGYAAPTPEGSGWLYSQAMVALLVEYQVGGGDGVVGRTA